MQRPVLILGRLEGVATGIRQLRRISPLETEVIRGLRVPTLAEMARIKAWLLATRYTVRDYLDTVVLFERLGEEGIKRALRPFDVLYAQLSGASPLVEAAERLGEAMPTDSPDVDLQTYRGIRAPWNDWPHVAARGRHWCQVLSALALADEGEVKP